MKMTDDIPRILFLYYIQVLDFIEPWYYLLKRAGSSYWAPGRSFFYWRPHNGP